MEEIVEGTVPQNTPEGPTPTVEEGVKLSQDEYDDLKHKAEVSSQNFERAKKAESKLKEFELPSETIEVTSEVDAEELGKLKSDLSEIKGKLSKSEVLDAYPIIKEHWDEFEKFRELDENKGMNLRTAAKSFLIEKGLLEPTRKGLEKPTGGTHAPVTTGMSAEDVKHLRETDYRKYTDMLTKGLIQIS